MVQLTRIYTKSGDKGKTALGNGQRVYKNCARIEAIGEVDEANAFIGSALQFSDKQLSAILFRIQNDLFDLGADLCVPENPNDRSASRLTILSSQVDYLEQKIDELNSALSPLTSFVLPGGTQAAVVFHLARTVTRRAERRVIALNLEESVNPEAIKYLNRLSDLLFVMARFVNVQQNAPGDILWVPGANR